MVGARSRCFAALLTRPHQGNLVPGGESFVNAGFRTPAATPPRRLKLKPLKLALAAVLTFASLGAGANATVLPSTFDMDLLSRDVSPRAIVGFRHDVDRSTIRRLASAGVTKAAVLPTIDAVIVLGSIEAYKRIATWSDVQYVDADGRIRLDNYGAKKDTKVSAVRTGARPLKRGYTGKGVTVAVIDSGIDSNHPDLAGRVAKHVNFEPAWFMDAINDGEYTDQFAEATGNPIDSLGHGTHVAGIVGGTGTGGQGEDFSGVAPEATLVNLKIVDVWHGLAYDLGFETNALLAYEWMMKHRNDAAFPGGIRVATNSWATIEADDEFEPTVLMVQAAYRKGVVSVFSAGNAGPNANTVGRGPNRAKVVITVAAVCKTSGYEDTTACAAGQIANFSSRGPQVDIAAPGVGIFSTGARPSALFPISLTVPPPGQSDPAATANNAALYVSFSGTSMSAPHVAGIIALMLEANRRLTPAQVESILVKTARDRGKKGKDLEYGYGLADAHAAVVGSLAAAKSARR